MSGSMAPKALLQARRNEERSCHMGHAKSATDLLISPEMDLLNNSHFESLLRSCASGLVAYCGASPPCSEFSLLKLRTQGPTPYERMSFR